MRQKRSLSIGAALLLAASGFCGLLLLTGAGVVLLNRNIERERVMRERQTEFHKLSLELAGASDYLTDQMRRYVQFGDQRFADNYWREVKETKTRDRVVKRLEELGALSAELELIAEAKDKSDALIRTEDAAEKAAQRKDFETARRLMFDEAYDANKQLISAPLTQFQKSLNERAAKEAEATRASTQFMQRATMGVLGTALLATLVGSWLLLRKTAASLREVARDLRSRLAEVMGASDELATSSQVVAQGASEQAAAVEETSASLEELTGMSNRNAQGAEQAKALTQQTKDAAETGSKDMLEMNRAMADIKTSSGEIAKIIKTIDEIAFQTNLLALNAAVEAARAGEAGRGFAVVAEEVRNLAQRSKAAAGETATQIQNAISRSEAGVQICQTVATSLEQITVKARAVDEVVANIAASSHEQSNGVTQIGKALAQIDKVTQQSASASEETASAAEELRAQTQSILGVVSRLANDNPADEETLATDAPSKRQGSNASRLSIRSQSTSQNVPEPLRSAA